MRLYVMVAPCSWAWGCQVSRSLPRCTLAQIALSSPIMSLSTRHPPPPRPVAMGACERAQRMSQLSKVKRSRNQWKDKAKQRSEQQRYQRKQMARLRAERDQAKQALKEAQARLRQLESHVQAIAVRLKIDVVWLSLHLFLKA